MNKDERIAQLEDQLAASDETGAAWRERTLELRQERDQLRRTLASAERLESHDHVLTLRVRHRGRLKLVHAQLVRGETTINLPIDDDVSVVATVTPE